MTKDIDPNRPLRTKSDIFFFFFGLAAVIVACLLIYLVFGGRF